MKNGDFPLLNTICEKYFKNGANPFMTYNILPLADLCRGLISLDKTLEYEYMEVINRKNDQLQTTMSPSLSIKICEDFLDKINPSFKERFRVFLKNGIINLVIVDEENDIEDVQKAYHGKKDSYPDVNVGIYYNLTDPVFLIHEFFHGDNFVSTYSNRNFNCESETHRILSETISVFFEQKMISYLKELGYNEVELDQLIRLRYIDTLFCSKMLLEKLAVLDCYCRIGRISLEDYRIMRSFQDPKRPLVFKKESEFFSTCSKMENKLEEGYKPKSIANEGAYTFGVSLAFLLLEQEDNAVCEKVGILNERIKNISSYSNLFDNTRFLGISLNQNFYENVMNVFQQKIESIEGIHQNKK